MNEPDYADLGKDLEGGVLDHTGDWEDIATSLYRAYARGVAAGREERDRLRRFAETMMQDAWSGGCDGGDVQDAAEQQGVIVPVEGGYDPEKHHDPSGCCEPGDTFYVMAWNDEPALPSARARDDES
jgi:hypothetical protein